MKRYINCGIAMLAIAAASVTVSCSKEEAYDTAVMRDLQMTLDGEPWSPYYGTDNKVDPTNNNRPIFVYLTDGSYYRNMQSSYRFSLESGEYLVLATNQSTYLNPPTSLNDQIIEQDPETRKTFAVSAPVVYSAGSPMTLELKTRTGMLRLRSTDVKSDKSYSAIRTVITTPVTAYHVGRAEVVLGESYELVREKDTSSGGVGFTEDAMILGSDQPLNIRLDYLDNAGAVVKTRTLEGVDPIKVLPNDTTVVEFMLNNPDERVTINYNIVLGPNRWTESTLYPSTEVKVPEGYTYVAPGELIDDVIKAQAADPSVDEIRIFLKASASYKIGGTTTNTLTKSISILGQTPGYGQSEAVVTVNSFTFSGTFDRVHFENIEFSGLSSRLFNINRNTFTLQEVSLVNCRFPNRWNQGIIWYQIAATDRSQIVHKFRMERCTITNFVAADNTPLFNLPAARVEPIYNWEFTDCLFHGNFGSSIFFMKGLDKTDGPVSMKFDGCKFLDTRGGNFTMCNVSPANTTATVTITDCLVGSSKSGVGTWMVTNSNVTVNASGNTRAKGYDMKAYGFTPEPDEVAMTFDEIISSLNL
ncbi:hypothetical protein [Muribaculum intestinale]|jgi:hypothetical protein|uniref:hypothetical protein n=1 Tax=Muribaculum intestinale TaxID=1796646 RepID=UPI0012B97AF5|nr:hypothetical protein [Muribaculum intestinale]